MLKLDELKVRENVIDRIVRFRARAMLAISGSYIGASRSKRSLSQ